MRLARIRRSARRGRICADAVGLGRERDHVRITIWSAQAHTIALVTAAGVVARDVLVQNDAEVAFAGDGQPVGALTACGPDEPLRWRSSSALSVRP